MQKGSKNKRKMQRNKKGEQKYTRKKKESERDREEDFLLDNRSHVIVGSREDKTCEYGTLLICS